VNLIYALLALAILIARIGITNTLGLSIFERTRELRLLRAIGMTRRQLRATVRWESMIIALFGTVLGLTIGLFFGWSIVHALADQGFTQFVVPAGPLVVAVIAAIAEVAAVVLPARRAARLDVLGAIASQQSPGLGSNAPAPSGGISAQVDKLNFEDQGERGLGRAPGEGPCHSIVAGSSVPQRWSLADWHGAQESPALLQRRRRSRTRGPRSSMSCRPG